MVPKKGIFCSGDSRITCRSTVRRVGVPTALSHEAKSGPFSAGTSVPTEDAHRPPSQTKIFKISRERSRKASARKNDNFSFAFHMI